MKKKDLKELSEIITPIKKDFIERNPILKKFHDDTIDLLVYISLLIEDFNGNEFPKSKDGYVEVTVGLSDILAYIEEECGGIFHINPFTNTSYLESITRLFKKLNKDLALQDEKDIRTIANYITVAFSENEKRYK